MKTMLDIAIEVISQDTTKSFDFDQIFEVVEDKLKSQWEDKFVTEEKSYEDIRKDKIGELYRLLTVDRRFERNKDGSWKSKTFEVF
ncbi:DNA-directed RNA polymerase subunit delta [Mycoplasmopsis sturni]|uniref:DNA-directed RNA polymerase subunit delta n=1 Tax=Mycoplasmopsis sturni TaxID=39047 RepID=UPI000564622A|nr:hypothetical protein [Mycoplasmopsis sturni]